MGFRFRRSVKLFPGVRLNVSRSGLSASFGIRGAHVTLGPKGTRTTVGIPGTGISYTETSSSHRHRAAAQEPTDQPARELTPEQRAAEMQASEVRGWFWFALIVAAVVWIVRQVVAGQ